MAVGMHDDWDRELGTGFVTASQLAGQPVPPRRWHVPAVIPGRTVTLLNGDGGTGKSLLALQLGVCTALGTPWMGFRTHRGPALVVSAEDDQAEMHRRLVDIVAAEGAELEQLDNLMLWSLAGADALMAAVTPRSNVLKETPLFQLLEQQVALLEPAIIVLDTCADMFAGNENDRGQVRQFIGQLRGLAMRNECAVLLLAHPSVAGMANGSGFSGSTAWNNSVRSRLYLERVVEDGMERDTNARRLTTKKSNYSAAGVEVTMRWQEGAFTADPAETSLERMGVANKAERVFLVLLRAFSEEGRRVTHKPGTIYAPKLFGEDPRAERVTKAAFKTAMASLFAAGKIRVELDLNSSPSRRIEHLVEGGNDDR